MRACLDPCPAPNRVSNRKRQIGNAEGTYFRAEFGHAFGEVYLGQVAIYCRVSTNDQSCERQERDLRQYAKRVGIDVVDGFALAT
jgi:hypothetical protein